LTSFYAKPSHTTYTAKPTSSGTGTDAIACAHARNTATSTRSNEQPWHEGRWAGA